MTIRKILAFVAVVAAGTSLAQDEATEEAPAEGAPKVEKAAAPKVFQTLPFVKQADGIAEVLVPLTQEWVPAEAGRYYPLGSGYRVSKGGRLVLAFGAECLAEIAGDASFSTQNQDLSVKSRCIILGAGELNLTLPRNMADGAFFVSAPGFKVKNAVGESKFIYTNKGDGDEAIVRCVTGQLALDGRHFSIPQLRAADELRIRTSHDHLETFLYGTSGDYIVKLDRGVVSKNTIGDDGSVKASAEKAELDWHLSPTTEVRINRMLPALGERMSVAVMTFDASGEMKNNFAFSEGRAEVNTGELVKASRAEGEDIAKRAAEVTEEAAAAETTEEEAAPAESENKEQKKDSDEE